MQSLIWVGTESLENTKLPREWYKGSAGAVIEFRGCVRNENEGREVEGMHYDAHPLLATKSLVDIRAAILRECPVLADVFIYHRVGTLALGETSLLIGVASPHRIAAFAACQKIIDEIKRVTPIWKREFYVDQTAAWLDGTSLKKSLPTTVSLDASECRLGREVD